MESRPSGPNEEATANITEQHPVALMPLSLDARVPFRMSDSRPSISGVFSSAERSVDGGHYLGKQRPFIGTGGALGGDTQMASVRGSGLAEALALGVDRSRVDLRKPFTIGKRLKHSHRRNYWSTVLGGDSLAHIEGAGPQNQTGADYIQAGAGPMPISLPTLKPLKLHHYLDEPSTLKVSRPATDFELSTNPGTRPAMPIVQSQMQTYSPRTKTDPSILSSPPSPVSAGCNALELESKIQVKSYVCRDCKLRFATRVELSAHSGTCPSRLEDRPYKCNHCSASFRKSSNLIKHISLVELKLRPHVCPECKATFGQKSNLTAHIRTIHNGERRYACEIDGCTRRFGQNSGLRAHVRTVHLGARDFVCECSRRFGSRGDLNRHIRSTHLKLLPFPCMDCGKAFSRKSVLLRHRAAVHGKNLRTKSPPLSQ